VNYTLLVYFGNSQCAVATTRKTFNRLKYILVTRYAIWLKVRGKQSIWLNNGERLLDCSD